MYNSNLTSLGGLLKVEGWLETQWLDGVTVFVMYETRSWPVEAIRKTSRWRSSVRGADSRHWTIWKEKFSFCNMSY